MARLVTTSTASKAAAVTRYALRVRRSRRRASRAGGGAWLAPTSSSSPAAGVSPRGVRESSPRCRGRRDIKGIRNLQEGRHSLGRKICHGKKGELYHRYERGLENQLGALGLVLNCVTLWTTVYLDAAVRRLRAQGYPVLEEDMARLSPFVSRHLGVHGTIYRALQQTP